MGMFFSAPKKHELTGKRISDTKHSCYYCQKMLTKIPRHLESPPRNEDAVVEIRKIPLKSKERTLAIENLQGLMIIIIIWTLYLVKMAN